MQARFTGDPRNGGDGPAVLVLWGHQFRKGEWADVRDAGLFARLEKNDHFETGETATKPEPQPKADADLEIPKPGSLPEPEAGKVPSGWRELHWKKRVALARQLEPELADTINTAAEADQVIEWSEGRGLD